MKILITGAGGFVGRELLAQLYGNDIVAADTKWGDGLDCRKYFDSWGESYGARFDVVYHCAAFVNGREGIDGSPAYMHTYNTMLDSAMFEWALRAKPGRVVYFSSSAAYPYDEQMSTLEGRGQRLREELIDLNFPEAPEATYGWSKLHGEQMARDVRNAGVPVTVLRPFSGYGAQQDHRYPFRAFLERAIARSDPFEVWGDGTQVRDWIHISDLVSAAIAAAENDVDGPVNVCTGVGTTFNRLAERFRAYADPTKYWDDGWDVQHLLDKPAGVQYRVGDPTKLHEFYTPKITIEQGVRDAVEAAVPG